MPNPTDDAIAELTAAVAENASVIDSAIQAFNGLLDRLEGSADDPDQIRAEIAAMRAKTAELGAAVANVPA